MTPPAKMKETCPSFSRGHIPSVEDAQRLLSISAPHVEGFDYFLDVGLSKAISDIPPAEIDVTGALKATSEHSAQNEHSVNKVKFWVENVKISPPSKMDATLGQKRWKAISKLGSDPSKLNPRECRELGLMYSGAMTGEFCYQLVQKKSDGSEISGRTIRVAKRFGDMPIMVMSKACHLRGKTPTELVSMKEEVRQMQWKSLLVSNRHLHFCLGLLTYLLHPSFFSKMNLEDTSSSTESNVVFVCSKFHVEIILQQSRGRTSRTGDQPLRTWAFLSAAVVATAIRAQLQTLYITCQVEVHHSGSLRGSKNSLFR